MQTGDEVEGLPNCREFSQPLSCLYRAMQITYPRKIAKLFIWHWLKEKFLRELARRLILTSRKVLSTKSCTRNQCLFRKKMLSKTGIFIAWNVRLLKKNWHTFFVTFKFQPTKERENKACTRNQSHITYSHATTPLGQSERAYYLS